MSQNYFVLIYKEKYKNIIEYKNLEGLFDKAAEIQDKYKDKVIVIPYLLHLLKPDVIEEPIEFSCDGYRYKVYAEFPKYLKKKDLHRVMSEPEYYEFPNGSIAIWAVINKTEAKL